MIADIVGVLLATVLIGGMLVITFVVGYLVAQGGKRYAKK